MADAAHEFLSRDIGPKIVQAHDRNEGTSTSLRRCTFGVRRGAASIEDMIVVNLPGGGEITTRISRLQDILGRSLTRDERTSFQALGITIS